MGHSKDNKCLLSLLSALYKFIFLKLLSDSIRVVFRWGIVIKRPELVNVTYITSLFVDFDDATIESKK